MEVVIKGRKYQVEEMPPVGERLRADLIAHGWDNKHYGFHKVRGACSPNLRSAAAGKFDLGTRV